MQGVVDNIDSRQDVLLIILIKGRIYCELYLFIAGFSVNYNFSEQDLF